MSLIQIIILAIIQGLAELLPVSSSAHVIVAAKLMGISDTSDPRFVVMLLMLHTGTMFAVIVYFWRTWKQTFFASKPQFMEFAKQVVIATALTGVVGLALMKGIEHVIKHQHPGLQKAEVEQLFKDLRFLAAGLIAAGVLILVSGLIRGKSAGREEINTRDSVAVGITQGVTLPFRGFSRSGSTISVGLLCGVAKIRLEAFSFALAVVLTPFAVGWESRRLIHDHKDVGLVIARSVAGMGFSFLAGLVALVLLSKLLEHGRWWIFGIYCLVASGAVLWMYHAGY